MNYNYLPIGSIVSLRGSAKKVMVAGYFGVNDSGLECNYMGFPYPVGLTDPDRVVGFDQVDIQEIIFEGYKDAEQTQMFAQLDAYAKGITYTQQATIPVGQSSSTDNQ